MGISDLLMMLSGGANAAPAIPPPGPAAAPTAGGVGDFLSNVQAASQDQPGSDPPYAQSPAPPAAPVAPGPSTPPSDRNDAGLGGFLQRMVKKATAQNDDTGMSFIDRLGRFGGQMTDMAGDTKGAAQGYTNAGQQRVDNAAANEQSAKMAQLAKGLNLSPREQLMFAQDPKEWVKANASRIGFHDIAGGNTGVYGEPGQSGSTSVTAPKIGVENGEGYVAGADGLTDTGSLAQSAQQKAQDAVKNAQQKAMDLYHQLMAQAALTNAAANTARANKPAAGGGGGLPPGYVPR